MHIFAQYFGTVRLNQLTSVAIPNSIDRQKNRKPVFEQNLQQVGWFSRKREIPLENGIKAVSSPRQDI